MSLFKNKTFLIWFTIIFCICLSAVDATSANAAKKKRKKTKVNYELQVQQHKAERIKKLYEYFPVYEKWENAEIYPYDDFIFLNNFDKRSVFEDFYLRKSLLHTINDWLGVRYRLPGRSRNGVDCSNFVSIIISSVLEQNIPAGASQQSKLFAKIENADELQFGDLVFFSGRNKKSKRIGHVGIYIGNGLFAHSATNHGVTYTHLSEGYYQVRYRFGGRIYKKDMLAMLSPHYTK